MINSRITQCHLIFRETMCFTPVWGQGAAYSYVKKCGRAQERQPLSQAVFFVGKMGKKLIKSRVFIDF